MRKRSFPSLLKLIILLCTIALSLPTPAVAQTSGATGTILRESWNNITGTTITSLTSNANYPNNPSGSEQLTSLEGLTNAAENYGARIRGYLYPPASGAYTFWLASDDNGELWLSTNDSPANATRVAYVNGWTNSREWTKYASQQSASINLTAGQKYYIEVLQKEGTGGDNVAVAWQGPGIAQSVIRGTYLSPFVTQSGNTVSINAGGSVTGSFLADTYFSGGSTYTNTATIDMSQITSNPPPAAIFNSEHYGTMTYTIPNRSGAQTVTLYFAETYLSGSGQRLFNVSINGTTALSNFDIFAAAGSANRAVARTFNTTANSSGQVVIQFSAVTQNPKINGITVTGGGGNNTPTPTNTPVGPTPTPTRTPTPIGDVRPSAGCGKTRTLQNGTITIQSGGISRWYILRAPDNYNNTHPYKLIVAYHWLGGTANDVANGSWASEGPYYGLWNLANNSTIFVAPMGTGSGSNTGWPNTNGQDITFTDAILSQVENALCIDQSRLFATGFSYGAGMSYAIACARANVFRGVALYSGAQLSGCNGGTTPIAYFASHGLSDSVLNISSGRSLRDHFVSVNGVIPQNPPEPAVGSGTHICTTYQGGSAGHPVTWCAFDGDHTPNPHDRGQSTSWVPSQVWNFITSVSGP